MPVVLTAVKVSTGPVSGVGYGRIRTARLRVRICPSGPSYNGVMNTPTMNQNRNEPIRNEPIRNEVAQVVTTRGAFRAVVEDGVVRSASFLVGPDTGLHVDRWGVHDAL